jgi:hypothetical protein
MSRREQYAIDKRNANIHLRQIARRYAESTAGDWSFDAFRRLLRQLVDEEGLLVNAKEVNLAARGEWNRVHQQEQADAAESSPLASPAGAGAAARARAGAGAGAGGTSTRQEHGRPAGGGQERAVGSRPAFGGEDAETYDLLKRHAAGVLEPRPVALGPMPAGATESMRLVAEDMTLLLGLQLAVDDDRPLMYSTRFCAWRMGWRTASGDWDKKRASRVLAKLRQAGVISWVGDLPQSGTRLYAPPLEPAVVRPGPEVPALGHQPVVQPGGEVGQQAVVDHAQAVLRDDLGVVAARDGAAAGDHGASTYAGGEPHAPEIPSPADP